jgi:hypothetical protein
MKKKKLDLKGKIMTLSKDLKIAGLNVRLVICDNAGKNMIMKNDPEVLELLKEMESLKKLKTLYGRIGAGLRVELRDRI